MILAHRRVEVGLETTLRVHRMRTASQEAIEAVRRRTPPDVDVMVVVDAEVEPEQVSLAADHGVRLVDARQLAESARLGSAV